MSRRLQNFSRAPRRVLDTIHGEHVSVPDPDALIHLQFRRFAGCPVCNLHLRTVVARNDEIRAAGIREVVVFHSTREDLSRYAAELPFDVVADPGKRLYAAFGVESSKWALLSPKAWGPIVRGVLVSLWGILRRGEAVPPILPHGGSLGLPGDFLIASDGKVVASKYGEHAFDQWSVDQILELGSVWAKEGMRDAV